MARQELTSPMKRLATTIALAALALTVAACSTAGGTSTGSPASLDPNALQISANNLQFSTSELNAPADEPFKIQFENKEGAPHNVAIYNDESRSQRLFGQDPFSGPQTVTYEVPALAAGQYLFLCDVHPDMKGTLNVQ
jgi:plastocyanin